MTRYTEEIRIRVSAENKAAIQAAADRASLDMSSWARTVLVEHARQRNDIYLTRVKEPYIRDETPSLISPQIVWPTSPIDPGMKSLVEKIVARPMEVHHWTPHYEVGTMGHPDRKVYVAHSRGHLLGVIISFAKHVNCDATSAVFTEFTSYSDTRDFYDWIKKCVPGASVERFPDNAGELK
jgi:hypothetical protein